jgi:hypothetical protein
MWRCNYRGLAILAGGPWLFGQATLLVQAPYGPFGRMNPTGHAAVYLARVCADSPVHLRRCQTGEDGVVLSRYHKIDGYDWLAIPLIPYLYAVENPADAPAEVDAALVSRLRDDYRRTHLLELVPNRPDGSTPGGEWVQLIGASYNRKIYGFEIETSEAQDDALIATLNAKRNHGHWNLFLSNCADFARYILDFYYPGAASRSVVADGGFTTPKEIAKDLTRYARKHEELQFSSFVIPQGAGTLPRSKNVYGVFESLVKSPKYAVPLAVLHPWLTAFLAGGYVFRGRFNLDRHAGTTVVPEQVETVMAAGLHPAVHSRQDPAANSSAASAELR